MRPVLDRISAILVLVLVASLLFTTAAGAESANRKIVVFATSGDQLGKERTIKDAGGAIEKPLPLINAFAAWLSPQAEKNLERKAGVLRIDDDIIVHAIGKPSGTGKPGGTTQPVETTTWGVGRISAPSAWAASTGSGVKVGVIDTGISLSHPDLKVWGGVNTINSAKSYDDDNGHGSHVAGIIAATDNSIGVVGVAPNAQLYAIKVLSRNGTGWLSDIIEGLDWAVSNDIDVVNMSLGSGADNQSFRDAVARTYSAGVTLVVAAGNSGPDDNTVQYPAKYPEVIAVSASDQSDTITSWSSRGPEVDLIAPGASIFSTYKGSSYATLSGTSMAAPHVTGVVALRMAVDTNKSPAHIASVLKANADSLPGLTSNQQGSGLVHAYRVVTAP